MPGVILYIKQKHSTRIQSIVFPYVATSGDTSCCYHSTARQNSYGSGLSCWVGGLDKQISPSQ